MKIPHLKVFEDFYRGQWIKQNKLDCEINPKLQGMFLDEMRGPKSKNKVVHPYDRLLTKAAETVNNLLCHGMTPEEIGSALQMNEIEVRTMMRRYALPRK